MLRVSVNDAEGRLADLIRRAEAGDEVVLTRHGQPVARLSPVAARPDRGGRRALIETVRASAAAKAAAGLTGTGSQTSLYDDDGLPA